MPDTTLIYIFLKIGQSDQIPQLNLTQYSNIKVTTNHTLGGQAYNTGPLKAVVAHREVAD